MSKSTIAEFVSRLKNLDVQISIDGEETPLEKVRLRCSAPDGILTPELRQELIDRKTELILYLSQERVEGREEIFSPIIPSPARMFGKTCVEPSSTHTETQPTPLIPLSFAQQRLWFLYQLAPHNPFYNVPAAIRLSGTLDQRALERSFQEIVRRHAALRTTFTTVDGQPVQVITSEINIQLAVVNLQTVDVNEREQISQQLATVEAQRPFNLTTDPLLRVTLLQFEQTESVLLLTMHHIVADGWSLGVLIRELVCCYTALVEKRSPVLPSLPLQYTDFARWQRQSVQGEVLAKQLAYWRKQLQNLTGLELPSDRPRPAVQTYRGATRSLHISPTLTRSLMRLGQQSGVSLFMILLAAFQTLLYRYTGQEDIAVGSPIANRHRSEWEGLIGFFVNSLVIRTNLAGNPTFLELLERVRQVALEAYEHQDLPFEKLVEELEPERDLGRNPLFQIAFALQNAPMQSLDLPGLKLEPLPLESGSTRFDLEVHLWEPAHGLRSLWQSQEGLSGFIAYSTDLFAHNRINRMIGHFQTLLEGIVANPNDRLSELPLLTPAERQQILGGWNQPFLPSKTDRCFHQIFEAQVQAAPESIALVSAQGSLTYRELNQRAEQLAQTLQQLGVQPDSLVGLCVERSADMMIGILGIFKAGGAYVPLDPSYPSDRLHFILTDTQVTILLTQSWLVDKLPRSNAQVICLDQPLTSQIPSLKDVRNTVGSKVNSKVNKKVSPDHLAYVIYTSGSTGTPKGVLLSHRGLCNVVEAQQQIFHASRSSRILQFSSLSFDASIFEIALTVGSGSTLYIPPPSAQLPGTALLQFLKDHAITHALLTPAVLTVLPDAELPDLQILITGGEACSRQVVDRWAANRHFFNAYGPTETTIWATVAQLLPGDNPLIIGRPILNTQIYILDAHFNPVPAGIPGELYIGGAGLARGYLNRPALTTERFITFNGHRIYKTGDRAQYREDGAIEFLGRVDHQIKIRGFRVELGEIEATLKRHLAIQDVAVIESEEASYEKRLVAYFSLNPQYLQKNSQDSLQTQQIHNWQTLYNQTYQEVNYNSQFNTTGWNSSYTGEPIPVEQMQEWVDDRVRQILDLKPKRVLEIGCGTGLLLFQIAPHCQTYVGTDFSAVSLKSIQTQVEALNLPQVKLLNRMATDFEGIDQAAFDVVILNSIVQYFPSGQYLIQVLEGAIQAVAPGGVLLVGDVRSLPLLHVFHTWMQFTQAEAGMTRDQLRQRVERSQFEETELAIDPDFFYRLRDRFPQICQAQIYLSRGCSHNEMTQFRYNVFLHIEDKSKNTNSSTFNAAELTNQRNWQLNPISVEETRKYLLEIQPDLLMINNITNSRVDAAVKTAGWLHRQEAPKTVGRMRDLLEKSTALAIDPQDWWNLEAVLPYSVKITWSMQAELGDYDVLLVRHGVNATVHLSSARAQITTNPIASYTNHPLQANFARQLVPELRQYLRQTLPDYMLPACFVPLTTLPLTVSGKVNRLLLSTLNEDSIDSFSTSFNTGISTAHPSEKSTPLTPTETNLSEIWKDLLRLKQVNREDNFFELGGHSLLATQMTSRIRDVFGLELPLKSVFEAPTIAQLAPLLETLHNMTSASSMPPLMRLDRSAFRHKRVSSELDSASSIKSSIKTDNNSSTYRFSIHHSSIHQVQGSLSSDNPVITAQRAVSGSRSPLVLLTQGSSQSPFFCVHPMFGVVFPYLELAHHLGGKRSFYGLQPLGLDGKSPPLTRIETIAAYYIQAIQTVQPHGPYFLGGWSFGGLVAFEMAQQLTQAGQQIGLLAILDTPAPCYQSSGLQSLKFLLGTALWSTLPFLLDYSALLTHRWQSWNSWFSRWQWLALVRQIPEESRLPLTQESAIAPMLRIVYANAQAAYRYVPQPYADRVTLFKASEQPDILQQNPTLGWNTLANEIQLHLIPGNHLSLLKYPYVQTLAERLGQCLL